MKKRDTSYRRNGCNTVTALSARGSSADETTRAVERIRRLAEERQYQRSILNKPVRRRHKPVTLPVFAFMARPTTKA